MQSSPFWRILAVSMVAALLYVGHGLHSGGSDGLPSLVNTAHAGGVSVSTSNGAHHIYTTSEDGRVLYLWQYSPGGGASFMSEASIPLYATPRVLPPTPTPQLSAPTPTPQPLAPQQPFGAERRGGETFQKGPPAT
jgi:hypothetical protein